LSSNPGRNYKYFTLIVGAIAGFLNFLFNPFNVDAHANKILSVAAVMIVWWITEALPLAVVALLPLVLFPLLNISTIESAAEPYAKPVIFLFLGGFMLGLAIEKWNLHRRIALNILRITGASGNRIVLGFILATGLLSMWLSNTATTMMMFPIALSVIHVMKENNSSRGNISNFAVTIMLAIAYASNIGGIATVVGTPPNVVFVGFIRSRFNYDISFANWLFICAPLAILLLFILYWIMVKLLYPNYIKSEESTRNLIQEEITKLGLMTAAEKRVLGIFICTALLWIFRMPINIAQQWFKLDDTIIAILCTISLFICPSGKVSYKEEALLEWADTSKIAWGILLLFGGGISLATGLEKAGLMEQLGQWLSQFSGNGFLLVLVISLVTIFMSELLSNIAQVIVFTPVVTSLAVALKMDPLLLGMPMVLAASCAGMLPMGTPPNAIVFASGHIKFKQMVKTGFIMNLIVVVLITLFCWFLLPHLMKVM